MDTQGTKNTESCISTEAALKLLLESKEGILVSRNVFDEYGNYSFPTDWSIETPNTAIGTPLGLSAIGEIVKE